MVVTETTILDRLFDFLSAKPSPEDVLAAKATEAEEGRFSYLSNLEQEGRLSSDERVELSYILKAEHFGRMAKLRALGDLNGTNGE